METITKSETKTLLLELDDDGYPTDESLEAIRTCDWKNFPDLLAQIKNIWAYGSFGWSGITAEVPKEAVPTLCSGVDDDCLWLRLATAGWSGNESIIGALDANHMFYSMHWYMSARGGLHIYRFNKNFMTPDAVVDNPTMVPDDFDLLADDGNEFNVPEDLNDTISRNIQEDEQREDTNLEHGN